MPEEEKEQQKETETKETTEEAKGEAAGDFPEFVTVTVNGRQERITGAEAQKRVQMAGAAQVSLEQARISEKQAGENAADAIHMNSLLDIVLNENADSETQLKAYSELMLAKGKSLDKVNQALASVKSGAQREANMSTQQDEQQAQKQVAGMSTEERSALITLAKAVKEIKDNQNAMSSTVGELDKDSLVVEKQRQKDELFRLFAEDKELGRLSKRLGPRSVEDAKELVWDRYVKVATESRQPGLDAMERALNEVRAFYGNIHTQEPGTIPGGLPGFGTEGSVSTLKLDGPPKRRSVTDGNFAEYMQQLISMKALEDHENSE